MPNDLSPQESRVPAADEEAFAEGYEAACCGLSLGSAPDRNADSWLRGHGAAVADMEEHRGSRG